MENTAHNYMPNPHMVNIQFEEDIIKASSDDNLVPQINDFIVEDEHYRQVMFLYEAAIGQLMAKLDILKKEFQFSNDRNPIDSIHSRVKSKESITGKLIRKGLPLTIGSMTTNLKDIAGIRVVCPFIEDVYHVARMLLSQKDINLIEIKDYIREPKDNGYRSLHLILEVEVFLSNQSRKVPVELQIRTIAMNFWASTEHQLRYKKDRVFTEEIQEQLKYCADIMAEADLKMQNIAGDFVLDQW